MKRMTPAAESAATTLGHTAPCPQATQATRSSRTARRLGVAGVSALLVAVLMAGTAEFAAAQLNLAPNPSFERLDDTNDGESSPPVTVRMKSM